MEGHRFFDLTRFGVYDEYCKLIYGKSKEHDNLRIIWPIPLIACK